MQVIAIDQGTTATKGLLVSDDGSYRLLGNLRHRQILPKPGWVEHDAAELLANVCKLLELGRNAGGTAVALTNQGETVVAWDRSTGIPICNAIVWQDQRTADRIEHLRSDGLEPEVTALSGLPLDAYFSASKLRWILDNVPAATELLSKGRLGLGTSDAYLLERVTGRYVTDVTTAARTSLLNFERHDWDPRLCEIFGVPIEALPQVVECDEPVGTCLVTGLPIEAALVDQVAALYGHGCRLPGDTKVTFGTGAFALSVSAGRSVSPGLINTIGWQGAAGRTYAVDGGIYTAGAAVEWLMRIGLVSDLAELDDLAGEPAVDKKLCFVPALAGLACPHWDRTAAGAWIGLDSASDRQDLIKAVLEGIAFRMCEVLDALGNDGSPRGILSVDGGLARSRYFLDFFATVAQRQLALPPNTELTAFGAALLAGHGAIAPSAEPVELIDPQAIDAAVWRDRFTTARQRSSGWRSIP